MRQHSVPKARRKHRIEHVANFRKGRETLRFLITPLRLI
jgi:hypothetical protein